MTLAYNVVDADGHILEPLDLWDRYIDPEFRERRPRFVIDDNGKERLGVEGKLLGNPRGIGSLGAVGVRQGAVIPDTLKYADGKKGGFDPHARIIDMDADGIDAAFLYPSLGLFAGAVEDPPLAAAMCRAYNRWLADYCKPYPERLFGVAMLPMQSVELATEEMRYARQTLGMRGGFLRPNPYHGKKMINDPIYEPFWTMVEELDFSVGFHEGSTNAMPTVGVDRFESDRAARHMISHTMEMMLAAMAVIWGGVVDRHPRLRVGFLEFGRRLDRALARPDGPAFRRQGLQRNRPVDAAERVVPPQLLDLVRAGGKQHRGAGRLYRPEQDHVGDRLSAPGRFLPRRAADGPRSAREAVARSAARRARRRRAVVLRHELRPSRRWISMLWIKATGERPAV